MVINPSAVIGPSLCPTLNTSNSFISGLVNGRIPALYNTTFAVVDADREVDKIQEALGIDFIPGEQGILDTLGDLPYWGHL